MDREYLAKLCDARDTLCGFCEADKCGKCIVTHLIDDAFNEVQMMTMNDSVTRAQESIKVLNAMLSTHQWEPVRRELEFTINELKKCIPTKPFREKWSPNRCPNCNADLGGECDDGYYQNPYYEFCPECRQVLDYE